MKPFAYLAEYGTRDKILGPVPDLVTLKRLIIEAGEGCMWVCIKACYADGTQENLPIEIYLKKRTDTDKLLEEAECAIADRNKRVVEEELKLKEKGISGTSASRMFGMLVLGTYGDPHDTQIARYMEHYQWIWKEDDELAIIGIKYGS